MYLNIINGFCKAEFNYPLLLFYPSNFCCDSSTSKHNVKVFYFYCTVHMFILIVEMLKNVLKMPFISAQKLTLKTTIRDINNKRLPAIDVFAHAIGYLQKHLLDHLNNRGMEIIHQHKIHWVLTIPAIWDDPAKQFMREAAKRVCSC